MEVNCTVPSPSVRIPCKGQLPVDHMECINYRAEHQQGLDKELLGIGIGLYYWASMEQAEPF
jgi:hypothetical protein